MWKDILRGLCWITGSGELDIVPGLVFTMWITRTSSRDTPRTPFSGSKTSWLPINYIIIMDGKDSSIFGTDVSRISLLFYFMLIYLWFLDGQLFSNTNERTSAFQWEKKTLPKSRHDFSLIVTNYKTYKHSNLKLSFQNIIFTL